MTTRIDTISTIKLGIVREVKQAISENTPAGMQAGHYVQTQEDSESFDGTVDYAMAIFDAEMFCEEHPEEKATLKSVRLLLIAAGFYREIGEEELAMICVNGRGGKSSLYFKINGKKWTSDFPYAEFYN